MNKNENSMSVHDERNYLKKINCIKTFLGTISYFREQMRIPTN